jgi:hypothetical protein
MRRQGSEYREPCISGIGNWRNLRSGGPYSREIGLLMQEGVDSLNDRTNVRFGARPADPDALGSLRELFREMNRNHQDGDLWKHLRNLASHVQAVDVGHLKVQQNEVRRSILNSLQSLTAGASLIADLPRRLLFENGSEVTPDRRIVIYYKNSHQAGFRLVALDSILFQVPLPS